MQERKTTELWRRDAARPERELAECHGGRGALRFIEVVAGGRASGRRLEFLHDDVLPPGVSIGVHRHDHGEEYYYILSGRGVMTLDGQRQEVGPGDLTAVYAGGTHGLENTGAEELRVIVIGLG